MKRLNKIKNNKDIWYAKQVTSWIEQIKAVLKTDATIYTLDSWGKWNYFLYNNKIIVANILYPDGLEDNSSIFSVTMLKEIPKTKNDISIDIIRNGKQKYTVKEFLNWLSSPSQITETVDATYLDVVKFLKNYTIEKFRTERYLFYVKCDMDYSWAFNINVKDLKFNADLKIYVELGGSLATILPQKIKDIIVDDLSGKLSRYRIMQCKKAFIHLIKQNCVELQTNIFYALEVLKQTMQPIEQDWGMFICPVFNKKTAKFAEIFVDDFPVFDGKPYFVLVDNIKNITKAAAIDFIKPKYKTTGIYKNGHNKYNFWKLSEKEIKKLVFFLQLPHQNSEYTNWQYLIKRYNDNTGKIYEKVLSDNMKMPDYSRLYKTNTNKNKKYTAIHL